MQKDIKNSLNSIFCPYFQFFGQNLTTNHRLNILLQKQMLYLFSNFLFMSTALHCLLIDDDQDDQEIFTLALEESGLNMQCKTCNNTSEALQKLINPDAFLPDYIFLDLNMPRINGIQFLTEIKKILHLQHIPVVIYSTSSHPKDKEATQKLGAAAFITKPSGIKELSGLLKDFFQTHLQPAYHKH